MYLFQFPSQLSFGLTSAPNAADLWLVAYAESIGCDSTIPIKKSTSSDPQFPFLKHQQ
jgi:hypothetical protein